MSLHRALLEMFPDAQPGDWLLGQSGDGPVVIERWHRSEPQPSMDEIRANEARAAAAAALRELRAAAVEAFLEEQIDALGSDPGAPQAIRGYVAEKSRRP